ncbi:MAG: hypothetical protein KDC07_03215, partial [Chitinophagaceae bacterium]|nr:hypothetical protein [Chitinophagaceae bacterium]
YFSIMKHFLLIPAILMFTSCNAGEENHSKDTETNTEVTEAVAEPKDTLADAIFEEAAKEEKTMPAPDTLCYVLTEGDENRNINAVRIIQQGDKVTGILKYLTFGEPPAQGDLNGTIKDGIITADWTFIKDKQFYKIPVSFKMTKNALLQKPTAVSKDGQPYIPEDGEYSYKFNRVSCEYFPE